MTHFAIPLSPIVVQSLGWTLLHLSGRDPRSPLRYLF